MPGDVDGEVYQEISQKISKAYGNGNDVKRVFLSPQYYDKLHYEVGRHSRVKTKSETKFQVMGVNVYREYLFQDKDIDIKLSKSRTTCSCGQEKFYNKKEDSYYCPACE